MKDRIIKFIESEQISAAEFADKIGVQRSSVSHVLNGRNNPGFSFIQKILETYPHINTRWLMLGEGTMYQNASKKQPENVQQTALFLDKTDEITNSIKSEEKQVYIPEKQLFNSDVIQDKIVSDNSKVVERVLIFYTDRTFDDYRPAK